MAAIPPPVTPGAGSGGTAVIQIYTTVPTSIAMHTIEEHQLTALTNVSRPVTLAIAGVMAGAFVSLLPIVVDTWPAIGTPGFGTAQVLYVVADAIAFAGAWYFGALALRGERDARRMVADIKSRARRPVHP